MRFFLISSATAAALLLAAPQILPGIDIPSLARADVNVSVSIGTFYDDLSPYGSWTDYDGAYVFIPARLAPEWRPYTRGHWVYSEEYGWLWVSDEPFGWATYHYGRWGYSDDIGWYWVPGRRWAPAWVSWRRSPGYVVWAPLPPGSDSDTSFDVVDTAIPAFFWTVLPARHFLDDDLAPRVIGDDRERLRLVETAQPLGRMLMRNNVVANNALDVGFVEKATRRTVTPIKVKKTDDPRQMGKSANGELAVFPRDVKDADGAKPAKIGKVEDIRKQRAGEKPQGGAVPVPGKVTPREEPTGKTVTTQPSQPEVVKPGQNQQRALKKLKRQPGQPEVITPGQSQQQTLKKLTKRPRPAEVVTPGQPPLKKARKQIQEQQATQPGRTQSLVRKSKQQQGKPGEVQSRKGQGQPRVQEQPRGQKMIRPGKPGKCNPATGEGCAQ